MSRHHLASRAGASLFPSSPPLLTASTVTFLASWRGQLLICTVVLVLGAVYLIIRQPVSTYRRHRREALSRTRGDELVSMDVGEKDETGGEKEKVREKRGSGKRKKGLALKVPTTNGESSATGSSSMETSSLPPHNVTPVSHSTWEEAQPLLLAAHRHASSHRQARQAEPNGTPVRPPIHILPAEARPSWEIPLPDSPDPGSSRLDAVDVDQQSVMDGEASDSALSKNQSKRISDGFSIFPEEGYLPAQQVSTSGRKKRRKAKGGLGPSENLTSITQIPNGDMDQHTSSARHQRPMESPHNFPARRGRSTSLHLSADAQEFLDDRDRIIDSLRTENGELKAKEGKAREEARRARINEDMVSRDMDRMRRMNQKAESEGRRRENEVSSFLVYHCLLTPI